MTSVTGKRKANGSTKQLAEQVDHAPTDNKKTRKEPKALASQPEVVKSLLTKSQLGAADSSKRRTAENGLGQGELSQPALNGAPQSQNQTSETSFEGGRAPAETQLSLAAPLGHQNRRGSHASDGSLKPNKPRLVEVPALEVMAQKLSAGGASNSKAAQDQPGDPKTGSTEGYHQRLAASGLASDEVAAPNDSAAKLQKNYQDNRNALKRIRKLSQWFIKHQHFRAENMRKLLGDHIAKVHKTRADKLRPPKQQPGSKAESKAKAKAAGNGKKAASKTTKQSENERSHAGVTHQAGSANKSGKQGAGGAQRTLENKSDTAQNDNSQSNFESQPTLPKSARARQTAQNGKADKSSDNATGTSRRQSTIAATVQAEQSCYNRYGCPYNAKQSERNLSQQQGEGPKNSEGKSVQLPIENQPSASTLKKTKFVKVSLSLTNEKVVFCEYCYACYKDNHKCDYCCQIYFSESVDGDVDGKLWIDCDRCAKWNHPECEMQYGQDPQYKAAASMAIKESSDCKDQVIDCEMKDQDSVPVEDQKDPKKQATLEETPGKQSEIDEQLPYLCLKCRKEDKQQTTAAKAKQAAASKKAAATKAKTAAKKLAQSSQAKSKADLQKSSKPSTPPKNGGLTKADASKQGGDSSTAGAQKASGAKKAPSTKTQQRQSRRSSDVQQNEVPDMTQSGAKEVQTLKQAQASSNHSQEASDVEMQDEGMARMTEKTPKLELQSNTAQSVKPAGQTTQTVGLAGEQKGEEEAMETETVEKKDKEPAANLNKVVSGATENKQSIDKTDEENSVECGAAQQTQENNLHCVEPSQVVESV